MRTGVSSPAARIRRQTLEPVEIGQPQVEDECVGRCLGQLLERLATRGDGRHLVALEAQRSVDRPADGEVVVHHQDAHGARATPPGLVADGARAPAVPNLARALRLSPG